jgi:hypothetical protein
MHCPKPKFFFLSKKGAEPIILTFQKKHIHLDCQLSRRINGNRDSRPPIQSVEKIRLPSVLPEGNQDIWQPLV